jgi:3-dehydroquinate synthase II
VEAEAGDRTHTTIVQNAETIRFVTPDGVKAVPELTPGDRLLVRLEEGGRHFGMAIKETIMEK